MNKVYKFDYNYLKLLIDNKDKLLDNDLVILVTYIEILQDKIEAYENMRKEAIEYIDNLRDESAERQGFYNCFPDDLYIADINDLLNILNKVGDNNES